MCGNDASMICKEKQEQRKIDANHGAKTVSVERVFQRYCFFLSVMRASLVDQ